MEEMGEAHSECALEVQRMLQLHNDYLANPDAPDVCYACQEEGKQHSAKKQSLLLGIRLRASVPNNHESTQIYTNFTIVLLKSV